MRKSVPNSGLFLFAVILSLCAGRAAAQEKLVFSPDDSGGASDANVTGVLRIDSRATDLATEHEALMADQSLVEAISNKDDFAAQHGLDSEFTWIDRDGRSRTKSDLLGRVALLEAGPESNVAVRIYGRIAVVTGTHALLPDGAEAFFTRVWIRQLSNWRLLLYQETAPGDFSVKKDESLAKLRGSRAGDCDNPCRSLPYKPLSPEAEEIVSSFMAGEKALFEGDATAAGRIFADDALFISPGGEQPAGKAQRIASIRDAQRGEGSDAPPAVDSMALWVFGQAAVMSADQESPFGEMLRTTRIWARGASGWQVTFTQQTAVQ